MFFKNLIFLIDINIIYLFLGLNTIFKNMLNNGSEKYPICNSLKIINKYSLNKYN